MPQQIAQFLNSEEGQKGDIIREVSDIYFLKLLSIFLFSQIYAKSVNKTQANITNITTNKPCVWVSQE